MNRKLFRFVGGILTVLSTPPYVSTFMPDARRSEDIPLPSPQTRVGALALLENSAGFVEASGFVSHPRTRFTLSNRLIPDPRDLEPP